MKQEQSSRLGTLSLVETGWLTVPGDTTPQGARLTDQAKTAALSIIRSVPEIVPHLGMFLTEPGGLSLEIRSETVNVSLKVSPSGEVLVVPEKMRRKSEGLSLEDFLKSLMKEGRPQC